MDSIDPTQLGFGAVADTPDPRDFRIEALGAAEPVDWNTPFSVAEPRDRDQKHSDACVAEATTFYHENIKPGTYLSVRDLFSRIALGYGAELRAGILAVVNVGQANQDAVPDPAVPDVQNMRDKTGVNPNSEAVNRELDGWRLPAHDIDTAASTIRDYQGCLFGVTGSNAGWFASIAQMLNPRHPLQDETTWGHALYGKGYHMHDGDKCIIAKSSWCGFVKEHHIKENYFTSGYVFNPWTLIPRKAISMQVGTQNYKGELRIVLKAASPEQWAALCAIYGQDPTAPQENIN